MYQRAKQEAGNVAEDDIRSLIRTLYAVLQYAEDGSVLRQTLKEDGNRTLSFAKYLEFGLPFTVVANTIKSRSSIEEADLQQLGAALGVAIRQHLNSEVKTVTQDDLKMLRAFAASFKSGNENARKWLDKNATLYGNGEIINSFVKESTDLPSQAELRRQLTTLVKQLVGKNEPVIQPSAIEQIKAEQPDLYKEYMRLRREFNAAWKAYIANMVRASGKKYLPYDHVVNTLNNEGITHRLPKGFVGMIDDSCNLYTVVGKKINTFPGFDVVMNPDYDPKKDDTYVFRMVRPDLASGVSGYGYTQDFGRQQNQQKHENVIKSLGKVDSVRKKWISILKVQPETKLGVLATVLELLYKFSARIGSVGNQTDGKSTYGISTLLAKHLTIDASGITIRYPGKAAGKGGARVIPTVHKLKAITPVDKLLIRNLKQYLAGKEKDDRVFTYEANGKQKPLTGNDVNLWFKAAMGSKDAHVHMLRHSVATKMFEQLVAETKFKANISQSEMESQFKKMVTKIGSALGHRSGSKCTPMTVLMNYLDPRLSMGFFIERGYRVPTFLKKFTAVLSNVEELDDPIDDLEMIRVAEYAYEQLAISPNLRSKVHEEQMLSDHIVLRHEETPGDDTSTINTYNVQGDKIGGQALGQSLANLGVKPEKIESSDSVCSIGFSDMDKKWYGWVEGHDIKGYAVGDAAPTEEPGNVLEALAEAKDAAQDYVASILNPKELVQTDPL